MAAKVALCPSFSSQFPVSTKESSSSSPVRPCTLCPKRTRVRHLRVQAQLGLMIYSSFYPDTQLDVEERERSRREGRKNSLLKIKNLNKTGVMNHLKQALDCRYWQTAGERKGENPMSTPIPYIIIFGMSTPFVILAIAFANGWIKAPVR
ncbi:hypothetical protein RHGRI_009696 [Rhododendron griersonianum]|uniref:Uncharacterized protein n=1 Tax=Rhododendron griersonianum TaxID=479676 RepID=A0AAV6KFS8_9ERIC|nr:hypothetical protein RHGRI_009696 [Rhododendron griersonianum]